MAEPPKEQSSIEAMMHLSEVTKPAGAEGQLQAAQEFPQPEFRSTLPDIRMMAGRKEEEKVDPDKERLEQEMRRSRMLEQGKESHLYRFFGHVQRLKEIEDELDNTTRDIRESLENITGIEALPVADSKGDVSVAKKQLMDSAKELKAVLNQNQGKIDGKLLEKYNEQVKNENIDFDKYAKLKEVRLNRERIQIKRTFENLSHNCLDEINGLNKYLEHFRNPYPYDSRYSIQSLEQYLGAVNDWLRNGEKLNKEGEALALILKRDLTWCVSVARVTENMGPALESFFDGEMVLQKQRGPHTDILAEDYIRFLAATVDGLEPTLEQRDLIKRTFKEAEKLGMRERAVELQDAFGIVLYKLVAVGQKNFEFGWKNDPEAGENYAEIDEPAYLFLKSVFGTDTIYDPFDYILKYKENGEPVLDTAKIEEFLKKQATEGKLTYKNGKGEEFEVNTRVMNPFCMDKSDEIAMRDLKARTLELVKNYKEYFDSDGKLKGNPEVLALKVRSEADKKILRWERWDIEDPDFCLTDTVIRSMSILEKGVLAGGDLGWTWKYEKITLLKTSKDNRQYIEINNKKIYRGDHVTGGDKYSEGFWNFLDTHIVFKPNRLGVDMDRDLDGNVDIFYPGEPTTKDLETADGKKEITVYKKIKIKKIANEKWKPEDEKARHDAGEFSETEFNLLTNLAIKTFEDELGDPDGNNNPDLVRIQVLKKKDKSGKEIEYQTIVRRESKLGSIYETSDITTIAFWARHIPEYDELAYSRSTLIFPTIGWQRERWFQQPPYWRPEIKVFANRDKQLLNSLFNHGGILSEYSFFENETAKRFYALGKKGLQSAMYKPFNEKVKEYIKDTAWALVTPWSNNPGHPEVEYDLVMPIFLPPAITDVNFWRAITLDERSGKVSENEKGTVWHRRLQGKGYSELKWKRMDVNKSSWYVNNLDQLERWIGALITPHDYNRTTAAEVEKFYSVQNSLSEKEGGKRAGLSIRGNKYEDGVIRAGFFPQAKIFGDIYLGKVIPKAAEEVTVLIGSEASVDNAGLQKYLKGWEANMAAKWVNMYFDLPFTVKGVENYPGTASQVMIVTSMQARRIMASAVVSSVNQLQQVGGSIRTVENKYESH
jgi:hypothetical protein